MPTRSKPIVSPGRKSTHPSAGVWVLLAIPMVVLGILLSLLHFAPSTVKLSYELTPTQLLIHYGEDGPVIDRSAISSIQVLQPGAGTRLMGASLPGQYTGYWSFPATGRLRLYCTSLATIVVIRTADNAFGISPANPAAFQQAWETGGTGTFPAR